jgi:hypothetical protein
MTPWTIFSFLSIGQTMIQTLLLSIMTLGFGQLWQLIFFFYYKVLGLFFNFNGFLPNLKND